MTANELCNCNILRNSSSKITSIYDKALSHTGVKVTQYGLLKYVYLLKSPNLSQLSAALYQDRSTLGRNIRILEGMKLVSINAGIDKRQVQIELTNYGVFTLKEARKAWELVQKKIELKLGKKKQEQLIEILKNIEAIELKL
jgi:DNA-binding MarR family transcriptional regulator